MIDLNWDKMFMPGDPFVSRLPMKKQKEVYLEKYSFFCLCKPKKVVEIGVRAGYSAYILFQACPEVRYIGIDCNDRGNAGGVEYMNWAKKLLGPYKAEIRIQNSQEIESLDISGVDFVHVDGDHSYAATLHDLGLALGVIQCRGYVLVDDYFYISSVRKAVNSFFHSYSEGHPLHFLDYCVFEGIRGNALFQVYKADGE